MKKLLLLLITIATATVTDIDGNVYETVLIGDQLWMAENLKTTHYRNGDAIQPLYNPANNGSNVELYGKLYIF